MLPQALLLTDWKEIAKQIHACMAAWEALAVFGTAATKKNNSMAAWWSIIFFCWCGGGYLA